MGLSVNRIKYLKSLGAKKFRQIYNKFCVEGDKMVRELLLYKGFHVVEVFATDEWVHRHESFLTTHVCKPTLVSPGELRRISNLTTPHQVLAEVEIPGFTIDPDLIQQDISLYLDEIQDPGNLGTILRVADWFGIRHVFCSAGCAEWSNPKVIQASMGAFLRVKILETDITDLIGQFPELHTYGAMLEAPDLFAQPLNREGCLLVIGNESKGISERVFKHLRHGIRIPKGPEGGAESLNAAVAAGIICAVFRKK